MLVLWHLALGGWVTKFTSTYSIKVHYVPRTIMPRPTLYGNVQDPHLSEIVPCLPKANSLMTRWILPMAPNDWYYTYNTKEWTNNDYKITWLKRFDLGTAPKANRKQQLFICDGHDSHISAEFVHYSIDHNTLILLFVPHSSHIMQPFDVSVTCQTYFMLG